MGLKLILGTAWGDEGKGRFTDLLAKKSDMVVRFCGANNAGHNIKVNDKSYMTTIVPTGFFHKNVKLCIGPGVVTDPQILLDEVSRFEKIIGRKLDLTIDPRTPMILPANRQRDVANEKKRCEDCVGSVGFGAGYGQSDRRNRLSVRAIDLLYPEKLKDRVSKNYAEIEPILNNIYHEDLKIKIDEVVKTYLELGQKLKPYIADVSKLTMKILEDNKTVICESSQGALLDLDYGTWPFTTGTNLGSGQVFIGLGIPAQPIETIGIVKVFNSRAGFGPFPTKFKKDGQIKNHIIEKGDQYERFPDVPVRPLDVGWLDIPALRYVCDLHGVNNLALTHLDTLAGLPDIKVATHYKYGDQITEKPDFMRAYPFLDAQPVYQPLPGWPELGNVQNENDLHPNIKKFIEFLEKETNRPVKYISLSAERNNIIER